MALIRTFGCCAEKFADNPAIVGYDLLNEPFGDEALQISPLYEDVAARIRKHDKKAILFIEPQVPPAFLSRLLCDQSRVDTCPCVTRSQSR